MIRLAQDLRGSMHDTLPTVCQVINETWVSRWVMFIVSTGIEMCSACFEFGGYYQFVYL